MIKHKWANYFAGQESGHIARYFYWTAAETSLEIVVISISTSVSPTLIASLSAEFVATAIIIIIIRHDGI